MEGDERRPDGPHESLQLNEKNEWKDGESTHLVHRVEKVVPVERGGQLPQLGGDVANPLVLPAMAEVEELGGRHVSQPLVLLAEEPLLDHLLRGDAGVVEAGRPADLQRAE